MHVSDHAITSGDDTHLARVENTRSFVSVDQVRTWCGTPGTTITVRPVLDLNEHLSGAAYETPARLVEQSALVDERRNLGSHATPCLPVDLASISSSISAGVRNPCLLRGLELSSAAMLSSMPGP